MAPPIEKSESSQESIHQGPNERECMEETVSTVFPFVPPKLDVVFYDVKQTNSTSKDSSIKDESKVIEVPVYRRAYTALEAHYTEEPISNINPESPPAVTYEATKVVEGWEKGRGGHDSGYVSRNGSCGETEIKVMSEAVKDSVDIPKTETLMETAKSETQTNSDTSHKEETPHDTMIDDNKNCSEV